MSKADDVIKQCLEDAERYWDHLNQKITLNPNIKSLIVASFLAGHSVGIKNFISAMEGKHEDGFDYFTSLEKNLEKN